jgi:hypothetical protein
MKSMRALLFRYRLLNSLLALGLLLGALAVSPAKGGDIGTICSTGCIDWTEEDGCLDCQHCCSHTNGQYECTDNHHDSVCSE